MSSGEKDILTEACGSEEVADEILTLGAGLGVNWEIGCQILFPFSPNRYLRYDEVLCVSGELFTVSYSYIGVELYSHVLEFFWWHC